MWKFTWICSLFSYRFEKGPPTVELLIAEVLVVPKDICNSRRSYNGAVSKNAFCAGSMAGGTDTCQVSQQLDNVHIPSRARISELILSNYYDLLSILKNLHSSIDLLNSLQQGDSGGGVFSNNTLVGVVSFGKFSNGDWLNRFCGEAQFTIQRKASTVKALL